MFTDSQEFWTHGPFKHKNSTSCKLLIRLSKTLKSVLKLGRENITREAIGAMEESEEKQDAAKESSQTENQKLK